MREDLTLDRRADGNTMGEILGRLAGTLSADEPLSYAQWEQRRRKIVNNDVGARIHLSSVIMPIVRDSAYLAALIAALGALSAITRFNLYVVYLLMRWTALMQSQDPSAVEAQFDGGLLLVARKLGRFDGGLMLSLVSGLFLAFFLIVFFLATTRLTRWSVGSWDGEHGGRSLGKAPLLARVIVAILLAACFLSSHLAPGLYWTNFDWTTEPLMASIGLLIYISIGYGNRFVLYSLVTILGRHENLTSKAARREKNALVILCVVLALVLYVYFLINRGSLPQWLDKLTTFVRTPFISVLLVLFMSITMTCSMMLFLEVGRHVKRDRSDRRKATRSWIFRDFLALAAIVAFALWTFFIIVPGVAIDLYNAVA